MQFFIEFHVTNISRKFQIVNNLRQNPTLRKTFHRYKDF
jgi:hypothetical protein